MRLRKLLWIVVLGGLGIQSAHADSRDRWERRQERRERMEERLGNHFAPLGQQEDSIGPGEAARIAQARNGGGRVLEVLQTDEGWRVKLIKDGEVRVVYVSSPNRD